MFVLEYAAYILFAEFDGLNIIYAVPMAHAEIQSVNFSVSRACILKILARFGYFVLFRSWLGQYKSWYSPVHRMFWGAPKPWNTLVAGPFFRSWWLAVSNTTCFIVLMSSKMLICWRIVGDMDAFCHSQNSCCTKFTHQSLSVFLLVMSWSRLWLPLETV